ncbi:polymorphic toxin type 33 domain-containing protein, partial [Vallitalea maricola]|uniref:polymorphic toxin type 33 domain-containing protein n=1 Tax=Vallitalea maricola TaxID=3074433 RepID=UPI0030D88405
ENNDILFIDKNVIWKYVGEDTYEASRNLVHAGYGARSVEAAKKLNESSSATALGHAVQNRSLELTVEELQFIYSMDPHGAKEYVTGIPGYTQKEKQHKKELREELYKILTGEEIQYYKHKWSNWEKTDNSKGDIWGTVKSNADFALEVNDGIPDDLLSVVKPITYTAVAFYGLNTLGVFLEGVSIYGFRMASGLAANGMLGKMVADYNSTLGATDADEQFIINALNSTDKDEELLVGTSEAKGVFGNNTVGAAEKYTPSNIKMAKDRYLKQKGIDAHALKQDFVGKKNIAHYDLYIDKDSGMLWIYRKGGIGEPIPTYEFIK